MKARQHLDNGLTLDPERWSVVVSAFESAWQELKEGYEGEAEQEAARLRLAIAMMEHARTGLLDENLLRRAAVEACNRPLN